MDHFDKLGNRIVFDPIARVWCSPEELKARAAARAERAFLARPNTQQKYGALKCPAVISDCQGGVKGIQSMQNGVYFDSKSKMRAHYKEAGVIEVGNDSTTQPDYIQSHRAPHKRLKSQAEKDAKHADALHTVKTNASRVNLTSYRKDELKFS